MKNFLRALRSSWPYRVRLALSVVCALIAAVLWGLTFTSISPTLGILVDKHNLQEWTRAEINKDSEAIKKLNVRHEQLQKDVDTAERLPSARTKEKRIRDLTHGIARVEKELQALNRQMWFYQVAEL